MSRSKAVPGLFLLCLFWGLIFGVSDQLVGIILNPAIYQEGGLPTALFTLLFSELLYLPLGILGFFFFLFFLWIIKKDTAGKFFSLLNAIWSGVWGLYFFSFFFSNFFERSGLLALSVVIGVGFYQIGERRAGSWKEKAGLSFLLWLGFIFAQFFLLLCFLELEKAISYRGYLYLGGALLGVLILSLGREAIFHQRLWPGIILGVVFLGSLFSLWFYYPASLPSPGVVYSPKKKVNIIFLLADALRSDAVGIYAGKNSTPTIDKLAKQGIWFRKVISQGNWTVPSIAGIFTGNYPLIFKSGENSLVIPGSMELLAERLQKAGYHTVALISNHLLGRKNGFLQGFEQVYFFHHHIPLHAQFRFLPGAYRGLRFCYRVLKLPFFPNTSKTLTEKAIKYLRSHPHQPFFLYIHYMDPHDPYSPSFEEEEKIRKNLGYKGPLHSPFVIYPPYFFIPRFKQKKYFYQKVSRDDILGQRFVRELYLAEVRRLDFQISRLLKTLEELNLTEQTLIIFTSDHGEEFWEHGRFGHRHSNFQELLKVPLILWGAGLKPAVVEQAVELIDLTPSLMEYLGLPNNPVDQGKSFWSLLSRPEEVLHPYCFSLGGWGSFYAVQDQRYKLILNRVPGVKPLLFDLVKDPDEKINIYSPRNPEFIRLKAELDKWQEENQKLKDKIQTPALSEMEKESLEHQLRSLGYIR